MNTVSGLPSHVNLEDLKAAINSSLAVLSTQPSDTARAFLETAMQWANEWAFYHTANKTASIAPFALVYSENSFSEDNGWQKAYLFREDIPLNIGGIIAATGTSLFDVQTYSTTAKNLYELGSELAQLNLSERTTLIVNPIRQSMIYCPEGINNARTTFSLVFEPITHLTEELVDKSLKDFHTEHLEYPEGCSHVWHERNSRTLRSEAEAIVRDALYLHFRNITFRSQHVIREEQTPVGRPDVSIHDLTYDLRIRCLFELKVLRSKGMTKKSGAKPKVYKAEHMFRHARMGVRQAEKYKGAMHAQLAYLCVYDGRDSDTVLPEIEQLAKERAILYRKYFMQTSTRDDLEV